MSAEHEAMVRETWSLIPWANGLLDTAREAAYLGGTAALSLAAAAVTFALARRSAR